MMKKVIGAMILFLASLSSTASTTFMMWANGDHSDFSMWGKLTPLTKTEGTFKAATARQGFCDLGRYEITTKGEQSVIHVDFPNGHCNLLDMDITIKTADIDRFMNGNRVSVIFSANEFYRAEISAFIDKVE